MSYGTSLQSSCVKRSWHGWLEIVPEEIGSEEGEYRKRLFMPENGVLTWKEKWRMREKLHFSKFKNAQKDFSNESRGRKELKCDAKVMKEKLSDERNLELKIKIKFSLSILCISLKFRALLWWTRILTIGMQIELV